MSAETLRRAASLMRERAYAATPSADPEPGGWAGYSRPDELGDAVIYAGPAENGYRTGEVFAFAQYDDCDECHRPSYEDVDHIVSWHPSVAVVAAEVLFDVARHWGSYPASIEGRVLDFALAYLGEQS